VPSAALSLKLLSKQPETARREAFSRNPALSRTYSTVPKALDCADPNKLAKNQARIDPRRVTARQRPEAWKAALRGLNRERKRTAFLCKCFVCIPTFENSVAGK